MPDEASPNTPPGFPIPTAELPAGIFDPDYSGVGQTFDPPSTSTATTD